MSHRFQFAFDVCFIRAALRRDLLWKGYVLAGILLVLPIVMRLWTGVWDIWLLAVCVTGCVAVVWRFHALLSRAARRVCELWSKQAPDGIIRYELDEEGFDVILEHSRSRHTWEGMRRLWRYDDVWLIEIVKMQSVFFPPAAVAPEVLDFVVERCRAAGVRV